MCNLAKCLLVLVVLQTCYAGNDTDLLSPASGTTHERAKRWLIFKPNGAVVKIVFGAAYPVRWAHRLLRSLNLGLNVQANYAIPSTIVWPVPTSVFKNRLNNDLVNNSQAQLYRLLEKLLDSVSTSGRECVLRTICEVAETPLSHNGLFGEVLDVIFTPYKSDHLDEVYSEARGHGLSESNCNELYKGCPVGSGLLEKLTVLHLFK
ncbi:uncharacterized protein LOC109402674 [Aedes albopictus]|uniref:Uncharacterized protein n=1 Tax=Aedes albopictus TaxID=7160 RepID=A0ABM1YI20_AEDAL